MGTPPQLYLFAIGEIIFLALLLAGVLTLFGLGVSYLWRLLFRR